MQACIPPRRPTVAVVSAGWPARVRLRLRLAGLLGALAAAAIARDSLALGGSGRAAELVSVVVLSAVAAVALQRWVFAPVAELDRAARRRAAGDVSVRLHWHGRDEVSCVGQAFDQMADRLEAQAGQLRASGLRVIAALAEAIDARDPYTHDHSKRVADHAAALARRLGFADEHVERVRVAGLLHDVGKLAVPDHVLHKMGPLTSDEMFEMRRHSRAGADLIAAVGLVEVARWVLYLHERFDGSGYPDGLHGEAIPLESRILSVCDALEAMTSQRTYRDAMTAERAIAELERGAGGQFDPELAMVLGVLVRQGALRLARRYPTPLVDDVGTAPERTPTLSGRR